MGQGEERAADRGRRVNSDRPSARAFAFGRAAGLQSARACLDFFFPRACAGCGCPDPEPHRYFCWECRSAFRLVQPPWCRHCGNPVSGRIGHAYTCSACSQHPPHFDGARAVLRDEGPPAEAVRALKYGRQTWLAADLAELMLEGYRTYYAQESIDAVCAVPLHWGRRFRRGFNQATLLGAPLARHFGLDWHPGILRRIRPTPSQTRLTAAARAHNVRAAFRARSSRWLRGRRILLVDDVMTTGATADACARVLKAGGAARVWVLTLVRR